MKLLSRRAVFAVGVVGLLGASWLATRAMSQRTPEAGTLYVDENEEPQIAGQPLNPERVSLVRLIAERERYDGKEVVTQGFLVWACECQALFLSREDAFYGLSHNGLVLDGTVRSSDAKEDLRTVLKRSHLQYVTLSGTFHKQARGHLGAYYAGKLTDLLIHRIERKKEEIPFLRIKEAEKGRP